MSFRSRRNMHLVHRLAALAFSGGTKEMPGILVPGIERCLQHQDFMTPDVKPIQFYPEDRLYQALYSQYPQVRMLPADLSSFQPPPAKQFIVRQMELMDQGISRRSAFKRVEKEMDVKQKWVQGPGSAGDVMRQIQREEEAFMRKALLKKMESHDTAVR